MAAPPASSPRPGTAAPAGRIARSRIEGGRSSPDAVLAAALGDRYRRYREAFREAEAGRLPPFPVHLDADVTTRCQLRCPICPAGAGGGLFPGLGLDLDPSLYARALAEGEAGGLMSVRLGVTGEPLLLEDVGLWAAEAAGRGAVDVSLITNGQLLDRRASRALIGAGLTRLMVSVDAGSPEGYRRARPGGDFGRLVANIRGFLAEREAAGSPLPVLRLSFVEREGWEGERELFREYFSPLADYLSFQVYSPIVERGRMARGAAPAAASAGASAGAPAPPAAGAPPGGGAPPRWCPEPFTRMCLHADGGLFPCCSDYGRLHPAGSLRGATLAESWHSPAARLAREPGPPRHPACRLCRGEGVGGPAGAGTEDAKAQAAGEIPAASP